jgi:hypothetical protein
MKILNASEPGLGSWIKCSVDDIIEKNGEEVYYCHGQSSIFNKFDKSSWVFNIAGIYDAKNETFKVSGNFTARS